MNAVRRLRESLGLSRPKFAEMLGLSRSRIDQLEVELPEHLRHRLRRMAEEHGQFHLANEFSDADEAKGPPESYTKHREWHDLLEYVLEHDRKAAECITGALRLLTDAIRAREGTARARRVRGA